MTRNLSKLRRVPGLVVMGALLVAIVICLLNAGEGVDLK